MNSVCAIIVTYNPNIELTSKLLDSLRGQVAKTIVVDNGSESETINAIVETYSSRQVSFHLLQQNIGLAAAQNYGFAKAGDDYSFFILFDQDSIPAVDMVQILLAQHHILTGLGFKVGSIGPRFIDSRNGFDYGANGADTEFCKVDHLIASGSLISTDVLNEVGPMKADLFIYHVDREWCYRASHYGYQHFWVRDAKMRHTVGDKTIKVWLGTWKNISVHSPLSHYYVFRNSIPLLKMPYVPARWKSMQILKLGFMAAFHGSLSKPRLKHLQMMAIGLKDGALNRLGKKSV